MFNTKTCSDCKREKSIKEFYINTAKKDGRQGKCIICQNNYFNNVYYKNNKEAIIKKIRKYKKNNPEKLNLPSPSKRVVYSRISQLVMGTLENYLEIDENLKTKISKDVLAGVKRIKEIYIK
tara:strand:+ start:386 stop:751 length:366 start_codon:yes stop_codon:yes gene_type:complete